MLLRFSAPVLAVLSGYFHADVGREMTTGGSAFGDFRRVVNKFSVNAPQ
jgi:hypothetical protein